MPIYEFVANLHTHTRYSDGESSHAQLAEAAMQAGLDLVIVTDHNVWVKGPEHYYTKKELKTLLLVGEEVHDAARLPQKNHLLVFGATAELAPHAAHPQKLIDAAREAGALTFVAHPYEMVAPLVHEPEISWVNWEVTGFTGLEIWNYMSEFKGLLTSKATMLRYALNPEAGIRGPYPQALEKWDELTAAGQKIVAIGGADAHGTVYQMGTLRRVIFPYEFLFRQVNTHLLTETELTGTLETDRRLMLDALAKGHCFVGYDGAAPTRGFRFTAHAEAGQLLMGDEVRNRTGVTLQIAVPTHPGMPRRTVAARPAKSRAAKKDAHAGQVHVSVHLIRNGLEITHWENQTNITHIASPGETGVFRVEVRLRFQGQMRGWIYSNPIYLRSQ